MIPFDQAPLPKFNAKRQKRRTVAAYEPGSLRPSITLAKQAIGEVEAELDAAGIEHARFTIVPAGEVHLWSGDKMIAWSFAVTDEPPVIETAIAECRARLRLASQELEVDGG